MSAREEIELRNGATKQSTSLKGILPEHQTDARKRLHDAVTGLSITKRVDYNLPKILKPNAIIQS